MNYAKRLRPLFFALCLLSAGLVAARDYTVLASYPHYSGGFTQGLLLHEKMLYESSGQYGKSFLIYGDLRGGHRQLALPKRYFAEGITIFQETLYLLTWKSGEALLFDPYTLAFKKRLHYPGEGWGLTHDDHHLIMSDGSATLRFLDPSTFKELRRLKVHHAGQAMPYLNELEWHRGLIMANQWQTDRVLAIDAATGEVLKIYDLGSLFPAAMRGKGMDVLNGIAYDPDSDSWLVTGKYWPRIYRIRLSLPETATSSANAP